MKQLLKILSLLFIFFQSCISFAQFPPPAGNEGSTAIHKNSNSFTSWATSCEIERGFRNISEPDLGYSSVGSDLSCVGKANDEVVSLGDGGCVILSFEFPIVNGGGWDFAVFENSFDDYYLELAFVEVSSDGENFFRFEAVSLTQNSIQIGGFGQLEAEKLNNLAGKYRSGFGTPFDLDELKNNSGLNIDSISYVKIIDVIGCIDEEFANYDSQGNIINEPWPTPFPSSGFDLDAVGVINNINNQGINEGNQEAHLIHIYPNPATNQITVSCKKNKNFNIKIVNSIGREILLKEEITANQDKINLELDDYLPGIYFIYFYNKEKLIVKKFVKY